MRKIILWMVMIPLLGHSSPEMFDPFSKQAVLDLRSLYQEENFNEILEEKEFWPVEIIKIKKIRFSQWELIPLQGELKGYLNFSSNGLVLGTEVKVKRDFNPLEACLGDHEISLIGETASARILEPKPFTLIPGFGSHPWPVRIIPRPIFPPVPIGPWPGDPGWVDSLPPIIRGGNLRQFTLQWRNDRSISRGPYF